MPRSRASRPASDITPLSAARAEFASVVSRVRETQRPMFLTQHGRSAAVLLDVGSYESLLDELELLRDIHAAEREVAGGRGISHGKARRHVRNALGR